MGKARCWSPFDRGIAAPLQQVARIMFLYLLMGGQYSEDTLLVMKPRGVLKIECKHSGAIV